MTTVRRFDLSGELAKPVKTPEGWLEVEGVITRTGVFLYRNADGSERRELRLDEEVFHPDSLKSFGLRPVTDDHPPEFLTAENTRRYAVGAVSETIRRDGKHMRAKMLITDADAVAHLETKKKLQLSGGYVCELEFKPGKTPEGEHYDAIQRKIRGNHVALVEVGRAGPEARVRMDASDAVMVATGGEKAPPQPEVKKMGTKTIRHDGVSYELSEQGAELVEKLRADAAAATTKHETELKAAKDNASALQAKLDAATADLEKEKKAHADAVKPEKLREMISARVQLETMARAHLEEGVKLDSMKDDEIRAALIKVAYPSRKLDGKDASYVQAMFELAVEKLDGEREDDDETNKLANARKAARADTGDDDEEREDGEEREDDEDPEAARLRMREAQKNAWKQKPAKSARA